MPLLLYVIAIPVSTLLAIVWIYYTRRSRKWRDVFIVIGALSFCLLCIGWPLFVYESAKPTHPRQLTAKDCKSRDPANCERVNAYYIEHYEHHDSLMVSAAQQYGILALALCFRLGSGSLFFNSMVENEPTMRQTAL